MALMWRKARPRNRPAELPHASECAGMGALGRGVQAIVVGTPRGLPRAALWRQGMRGMGAGGLLDKITGGAVTNVQGQLGQVERALRISTYASVVSAGVVVLGIVLSQLRRR